MAKPRKFAGLKGRVPEAPTEREAALQERLTEYGGLSFVNLTAAYNAVQVEKAELAPKVTALKNREDALEILIRKTLREQQMENATASGFKWEETCEPYPVLLAANVDAVIKHLRENGYEDQLRLKTSEVTERLKGLIKTEAEEGELEVVEVANPDDGTTKIVVKSRIPGVQVYLHYKLSRTKGASR